MKQIDGGITAVSGIRAAGVHAGIKAADAKGRSTHCDRYPSDGCWRFHKKQRYRRTRHRMPRASRRWTRASRYCQ